MKSPNVCRVRSANTDYSQPLDNRYKVVKEYNNTLLDGVNFWQK